MFPIIKKTKGNNKYKTYDEHHLLSRFECHSKILEMNLLNTENIIENGSDFYLQNVAKIRLKNISIFKNNEVLSRLEPYLGFETIFLPEFITTSNNKHKFDIVNSFKFIYSIGLSLKLLENVYIDFAFYSRASNNMKIKKSLVNSFRITLSM